MRYTSHYSFSRSDLAKYFLSHGYSNKRLAWRKVRSVFSKMRCCRITRVQYAISMIGSGFCVWRSLYQNPSKPYKRVGG